MSNQTNQRLDQAARAYPGYLTAKVYIVKWMISLEIYFRNSSEMVFQLTLSTLNGKSDSSKSVANVYR